MPRAQKEPPRIPGYEILEPIGSGGQGSVWRARQKSLDRVVAIKVLWAEDASDPILSRRFIEEARIASKLNHPNIIQVIDVGETEGTYWYAMEYVAGVSALELFRERGPLPEGEVLEIAWQVAQALQHGTDRGLVHGDLKPENILITPEGVAKVVDFGLARLSRRRGWRADRLNEPMQGTEGFVAPEILENRSTGDARSDLFALGVTLYELLTTTLPPSPKRGSESGPNVRERRPNTTRRTAELLMRLLAPDPAKRPDSPAQVLDELGRRSSIKLPATVTPVAPIKPTPSKRLRRDDHPAATSSRRWILGVVIVAAAVGAVLLINGMFGSKEPSTRPATPATAEPSEVAPSPPPVPPAGKKPEPVTETPITTTPPPPPPRRDPDVPVAPARPPRGEKIESRPVTGTVVEPPAKEPDDVTEKPRPEPPPDPSPPVPPDPTPPTPPPLTNGGGESRVAEGPPVSSTTSSARVFPPPAGFLNAAWTVVTPAGDPCDLTIHAPKDFESKDTVVEIVAEGRAKGLGVKPADTPGVHVAFFRGDRSAPWGPRDFTLVFKRGGVSSKLRLRIQVVRPSLLALAPAPALRDALRWLERHQAPDGAISAADFSKRCIGDRRCDGPGKASCDAGVTAIAALAALRSGESGDWVRAALLSLVHIQKSDGRFASAENSHGAYSHMIATEACALGWHLLGDPAVRDAAQKGIEAIETARNLQASGGAWRYSVQSGDNDTSVTIWALRAILAAKMAGLRTSDAAVEGGVSWIRRVTETNPNDSGFGRIGYNAPGMLPVRGQDRALQYPPALSESLTAGALQVALQSYDRKTADKVAQSGIALVLLCRPYWDASTPEAAKFVRERLGNPNADLTVISPRDFYYWQHGTALFRTWKLLRGRSIPEDRKWNLAKVLTGAQRKEGCAGGSFDSLDPWSPEAGRAGSTAMLALALANEQYPQAVLDEIPQ